MKARAAMADNRSLTVKRRMGGAVPATGCLNAFFANLVNSPSMSMVNFPCCVRFVLDVTREVAAQPMRSAVRMETGVHAGV